jgi:hypothetical protein
MFYKCKLKDWLYLSGLVIITYLWITYDQVILTESYQRMIAFPLLGLGLMFLFYVLVKPDKVILLSNTMSLILIPLFIIVTIVLHLFIFKDGFQTKSIILWIMTLAMIYLSGFIYKLIFQK